jgi:hypothetical protein
VEFGAAEGFVSWKVPLAFENGGTHYANDLSEIVLRDKLRPTVHNIYQRLGQSALKESVKAISGSCLDMLSSMGLLMKIGKQVDVVYAQNVEHFFNPTQHQQFLALIDWLLVPGGYAFLSANSPEQILNRISEDFCKLVLDGEFSGETYYGFFQYEQGGVSYVNVKRPARDDVQLGFLNSYGPGRVSVRNLYTPEVYRRAVSKYNTAHQGKLEVVDAFFLDREGNRVEVSSGKGWFTELVKARGSHAAAIIRKRS